MGKVKQAVSYLGILPAVILVMGIFIQSQNPAFLTADNLTNLVRQIAILAIVSFGMTTVILTGNIDLSVGSTMGLASVVACDFMKAAGSVWLGILLGVLVGFAAGLINGGIIVKSGIHPFVATLGTLTVYKGIAYLYTQGMSIGSLPREFLSIGTTGVFGVPMLTVFAIIVFVVLWFVLTKTRFGLHIYEIGGREEAAQAAGIDVAKTKILVYGISGALAGLAGMLLTVRAISSHPSLGTGYHSQAIGASVIGGASLAGGRGKLHETVWGVLIMGILSNGLNLLKVSTYWQEVAVGATIVIAIVIDAIRFSRASRNAKEKGGVRNAA